MVPFLGGLYGRSNLPAEPKEFSKTTTGSFTKTVERNDRVFRAKRPGFFTVDIFCPERSCLKVIPLNMEIAHVALGQSSVDHPQCFKIGTVCN